MYIYVMRTLQNPGIQFSQNPEDTSGARLYPFSH